MQGMSERQYAAHVGLSRGAIQKAKTAERLVLFADGSISTPPTSDTILHGITRDALLTLARDAGLTVREEPYAFERVEVLKGPSSTLYGQSGPSGVVNLISKRPSAESHHEIAVTGGSFDRRQIAAVVGTDQNLLGFWD